MRATSTMGRAEAQPPEPPVPPLMIPGGNRWAIAVAGVVMQIALGAVYAWSVFRDPLIAAFGWSIPETTFTFTLTILTLGFAAFFGGLWMKRVGPRTVAIVGGILYGVGTFGASLSDGHLSLLYLTYGLIGGIGIGFAYIVPIAVLVSWFPDKRGLITGIAVAGFGAGALVTAPVATALIGSVGVLPTFAILGVVYGVLVVGSALLMRMAPRGYHPAGWMPDQATMTQAAARQYSLGGALRTWQWYALWAMLFLNVTTGISLISQAAPMAQEITGVSALAAAGVVGILSIGNGLGRLLWAWLSDAIGRRWVFLAMFLIQVIAFSSLPLTMSLVLFSALAFVIAFCYGGGFGTMPAFAADYFGSRDVGSIYGLMLTAWGFGAAAGPELIALVRQDTGSYTNALFILAALALISAVLPLVIRPPHEEQPTDGADGGSSEPARSTRTPRIVDVSRELVGAGDRGGPAR